MLTPRVNILLPTYEPDPKYLQQAIESVQAQTEHRWMLLIHDDASTTEVAPIIEPFLHDIRIVYARSPRRLGIGGNWNATLLGKDVIDPVTRGQLTGAPFVQYLFQDDRWEPMYLERTLAVMQKHPDVGCIAVQHRYAFEGESAVRDQYEALAAFRRDAIAPGKHDGGAFLRWWIERGLHPNVIGEPSFVMLRRELVQRVGLFSDNMPQSLDAEYWVRVLSHTQWFNLAQDLGTFRVHPSGASERNRIEGRGLFDRFRCLERALTEVPAGPDRRRARAAIVTHLALMIKKFRGRREEGGAVHAGGSGALIRFGLRHPLLTLRALRGVFKRGKLVL